MDKPQIQRLGGELGLEVYSLNKMQNLPQDMVEAWLRKEDSVIEKCGHTLTWKVLASKLQKIGQKGIACDILRDKCGQTESGILCVYTIIASLLLSMFVSWLS